MTQESLDASIDAAHGIVLGNSEGDVTLVEFFDYNCDYCRETAKDLRELLRADPNLRIVLRSYPLHGDPSSEAARVTWAIGRVAGAQRAYEFHSRLMESRGVLDGKRALEVAAAMKFDVSRLREAMNDPLGRRATDYNSGLARKLRLTGTPAYVVGTEIILGAVRINRLSAAIERARACKPPNCSGLARQ